MKLLLYASDWNHRRRMLATIDSCDSLWSLETYVNMPDLHKRVQRALSGEIWTILVTENPVELGHLIRLGNLIRNTRIILVLPDQRRETVSAGHTLYPRFISYLDSDFSDVRAVLDRVIKKRNKLI